MKFIDLGPTFIVSTSTILIWKMAIRVDLILENLLYNNNVIPDSVYFMTNFILKLGPLHERRLICLLS